MQRNMDLVRMILLRIEDSPLGWAARPFVFAGYTPEEVGYHARIMAEDGLIEAAAVTTMHSEGPEAMPRVLTSKGHDFLDLARDQQRWSQAKAIIGKVGSAPTSVWMKVLNDLLLKDMGVAS